MARKKRGNTTRLARSIFDTELYLGVLRRRLLEVDNVVCLEDSGGGGGAGIVVFAVVAVVCRDGGLQVTQDICQWSRTAESLSGRIEIADNGITSIMLSPFIAKLPRLSQPRVSEFFRRA
ncbi:hypothetical protein ACS0PU_011680 [Formica fusca]